MKTSKTGLARLKTLRRTAAADGTPIEDPARGALGRGNSGHANLSQGDPGHGDPGHGDPDRLALDRALRAVRPLAVPARTLHGRQAAGPRRARQPDSEQFAARRAAAVGGAIGRADAGLSDGDASHLLSEQGTVFLRSGMALDTPRKLRKGHWRLGAELDLHGLTMDLARQALSRFLADCVDGDIRCVRIVHGKGYGSGGLAPVLKDKTRSWLAQTEAVLAFAEASQADGGGGAVVVLLRNGKKHPPDRS